ncbi:ATP-binding protein, partial [Mycobacterium asiaticum]|uniref:ATP-binding protein n=1 Tax=Mycobacterium asiaticum TaxID=1790 RepID=UPI000A6C2713
ADGVRVSDRGTWHRPVRRHPDDPFASRGIMLMHTLADHCTINARSTGTTVSLDYAIPAESVGKADD